MESGEESKVNYVMRDNVEVPHAKIEIVVASDNA